MRQDGPAAEAYLAAQYAECRAAIVRDDGEYLIRVVDHIRTEAGEDAALTVLGHLLRLARNPITDPAHAACVEGALDRYQARHRR